MIIFITGPSGVGKSTLRDYYCNKKKIKQLSAFTTRSQRKGEIEIHKIVSECKFNELIENGELCLVAKNHGFYYGYSIREIIRGKDKLLLFEVDSSTAIRESDKFEAKILRILPTSKTKAIENIKSKRDDYADRLIDFELQMSDEFLAKRKNKDIFFRNNFDSESSEQFVDLIDSLIKKDRKIIK